MMAMEAQQQLAINGAILGMPKNEIGHHHHLSLENGFGHHTTNGDQNASNGASMSKPDLDYLSQLLKDKKQLSAFPNIFAHVERLVDEEINRVRVSIFQCEFSHEPLQLPEPIGEVTVRQEKVFVPVKQYPEYNFVGRILGPRGMTAKQLETETGCRIMVRGKGSMRDKKKEEMNRGKPNWEHLSEELHVIIQCEDAPNRAEVKMARAVEEVNKLLVPAPEGEDDLKKKQLMELAIINGTFRNTNGTAGGGASNRASPSSFGKGGAVACNASAAAAAASLLQLDPRLLGCPTTAFSNTAAGLAGNPLIMPSAAAAVSLAGLKTSPVLSFQSAAAQPSLVAVNNSLAAQALALQLSSPHTSAAQLFAASPYSAGLASVAQAATAPNAIDYHQQLLALGQLQQQQQPQQLDVAAQSQQLSALFQQQQLALSALQQFDYGSGAVSYGGGGGKTDSSPSSSAAGGGYILSTHRRFVGHSRDSAHPYGGGGSGK
ncbi:hypothetical protein niasHT_006576 [Heterodera trifolii]|uniref:K Homology domain-containing protein n=1 Tax=Heterodera trifolii TaxID=157864 RepID=A0ABD2LYP2_9BILA